MREGVAVTEATALDLCGRSRLDLATEVVKLRSTIKALEAERDALREKVARLERSNYNARLSAKKHGHDKLREEAYAALPSFSRNWEPLRDIAQRTGRYNASQLASRARELERLGLIESKWIGPKERTQMKAWRSLGRPVPVHASGPATLDSLPSKDVQS